MHIMELISLMIFIMPIQVEGIVGTYIANRKDPNSNYGVSLISFDKGGGWNRITAPLTDYRTLPVYCTPVGNILK